MPVSMLRFEKAAYRRGATYVAGMDEAGRGPLAGPVVAAAVILPRDGNSLFRRGGPLYGLTDSKQLTAGQRERFSSFILHPVRDVVQSRAASPRDQRDSCPSSFILVGIGIAPVKLIDQINILRATHWAMGQAIAQLQQLPDHILVDGRPVPHLPAPQTAIVGGDAKSYSIAAASVVAKVTRDRLMCELHQKFPHYGFADHKGYATAKHLAALGRFGPCLAHRRSFEPVRQPRLAL